MSRIQHKQNNSQTILGTYSPQLEYSHLDSSPLSINHPLEISASKISLHPQGLKLHYEKTADLLKTHLYRRTKTSDHYLAVKNTYCPEAEYPKEGVEVFERDWNNPYKLLYDLVSERFAAVICWGEYKHLPCIDSK